MTTVPDARPVDPELVIELLGLGTATVYEAAGLDCVLPGRLRPAWRGAAVAGPAFPVRAAPGDNLALHAALELVDAREVLVVDAGAHEYGYWGEVLTVAAQMRGVAGLIIDGGVRDVDRLEELNFPVFSSCIAIRGTDKRWSGAPGDAITVDAMSISRGDLLIADADGVIVVPRGELDRVVEAARHRARNEGAYLARLRDGELSLDIYGLRALLKSPD